ncbi:MAG: response regulator [Nitrospirota bacterium]
MSDLRKQIMVVDDEDGVLESFEVILSGDYNLIMARSGFEALSILKEKSPDLIFLDVRMPGMDGIEVLRNLKKMHSKIDVVIVTATEGGYRKEVEELGIRHYIEKPFDVFKIEAITKEILS